MKKSTLIVTCSAAAVFIAVLIVASFYDLQINIALGNADSVYGQFFRLFGELVSWALIPFCAGILMRMANRKTKAGIVLTVVWAAGLIVGWYLTMNYVLKQFTGKSYIEGIYASPYDAITLYSVVFALIFSGLHAWAAFRMKEETARKLIFFAVAMIIALALSQLVCEVMKKIWTRQRFRNLDIGNGGTSSDGFSPWYKPGLGKNKAAATYYVEDTAGMPKSDAYKSFPSGHSASAALMFGLVMLPELFDKLKKYKIAFWIAPALFTVAVMISRIVNRAHYLSDVLFGGTIGALSVLAGVQLTKLMKKAIGKNKFFTAAANAFGVDTASYVPVADAAKEEAVTEEVVTAEENKD